jgi:hypothetical protein
VGGYLFQKEYLPLYARAIIIDNTKEIIITANQLK